MDAFELGTEARAARGDTSVNMPRTYFPHTPQDVSHAVDGSFGLVVADMPDGTLWMLKRNRKTTGYEMIQYDTLSRAKEIQHCHYEGRQEALDAFWTAVS